jgi:hypothetical protein
MIFIIKMLYTNSTFSRTRKRQYFGKKGVRAQVQHFLGELVKRECNRSSSSSSTVVPSPLWTVFYRFLVSAVDRRKICAPQKMIFTVSVFSPACRGRRVLTTNRWGENLKQKGNKQKIVEKEIKN